MRIIALLTIVVLLIGCQAGERQIALSSTDVSELAHTSRARFEIIYKAAGEPVADVKTIRSEALSGKDDQTRIIDAVNLIIRALPDVQDVTSVWVSLIMWLVIALVLAGGVVLLFQTGFGAWIKGILGMITRKRTDA